MDNNLEEYICHCLELEYIKKQLGENYQEGNIALYYSVFPMEWAGLSFKVRIDILSEAIENKNTIKETAKFKSTQEGVED